MGPGQVADVVEAEAQQRPELQAGELGLGPVESLLAQPGQVEALVAVGAVTPYVGDTV